ncbi:hypothetical protein [Neolewinella agarilytica]|uniref:hypothetical protein n=1 Tax=Neolewinella agarilytica TaxID=478744 RepID=UPI00235601C3|nr:hypothetical protein [Neolewinella agarilytica]
MATDELFELSIPPALGIPYAGENSGLTAPSGTRGSGAFFYGLGQCVRALRNEETVYLLLRNGHEAGKVRQGLQMAAKQLIVETEEGEASGGQKAPQVFGPYGFAATVGLWLKTAGEPASALLSPFISTDSFEFTPAEFVDLRERIDRTMRRFARLPQVSRSLDDLNTGFFRHQSLEESRQFITANLEDYLDRISRLQREYQLLINGHARKLLFERQGELSERRTKIGTIQAELQRLEKVNGRQGRRQLKEAIAEWSAYRERWYGTTTPVNPQLPFPALREELQEELRALHQQRQNLNRELRPASLSLSVVTVAGDAPLAASLRKMGEELSALIREIDEAGLYQLPLGGTDAATAPRQLQLLESVRDRLRNTHRHLHELDDFYARRHFWYAQPARLRRLLAPLRELPPEEWETAFSSWYFERCLQRVDATGEAWLNPATLQKMLEKSTAATEIDWDRVHFVLPGEELPQGDGMKAFCFDLTGGGRPEKWAEDRFISLRPLWDDTADHYQLAGRLEAGLLFGQPFLPVSGPDWAEVRTNEAPPGSNGHLCLQVKEGGPWMPLPEWDGIAEGVIRLYLPDEILPEDGQALQARAEEIMTVAPGVRIFHGWSNERITQALLSDGVTVEFLAAVILRAAEAAMAEPYDRDAIVALGREYRTRCGLPDPAPHPLAENLRKLLSERLPDHFFELHQAWRDTFLPLVVLAPSGRKTVLLPDGRLPGRAGEWAEALRQRELRAAGFHCLGLRADRLWMGLSEELDEIVKAIREA